MSLQKNISIFRIVCLLLGLHAAVFATPPVNASRSSADSHQNDDLMTEFLESLKSIDESVRILRQRYLQKSVIPDGGARGSTTHIEELTAKLVLFDFLRGNGTTSQVNRAMAAFSSLSHEMLEDSLAENKREYRLSVDSRKFLGEGFMLIADTASRATGEIAGIAKRYFDPSPQPQNLFIFRTLGISPFEGYAGPSPQCMLFPVFVRVFNNDAWLRFVKDNACKILLTH